MTPDELEEIQSICRQWMNEPSTHVESRLTIPPGVVLSRTIVIEITGLLTFDNVLVRSADDVDTGVCYLKQIGEPGTNGTFIAAPFEMIESGAAQTSESPQPHPSSPSPQPASEAPAVKPTTEIEFDPDRPKFMLYSNQTAPSERDVRGPVLLGYSLLERNRGNNQWKGRFHPSDDYFDYSEMFAAFPQAENDCLEVNAREAYGLSDQNATEYRKRFNELSDQIEALRLFIAEEGGAPIETQEVRVEDLSQHYDDQTERWLHVTFAATPRS